MIRGMDSYSLVSLLGIFGFMLVAWVCSTDRRRVNWRVVGWGVGLQLALAALIFQAPKSREVFLWLNDVVVKVIDAARAGERFLFGPLALPLGQKTAAGEPGVGFVLAIQVFPIIIFFSALMALLYHYRIMPLVIRAFAWVFSRLMRISGAESLCASSNIFVGIESATTIRPYLSKMTRSEFCTILTAGMATVASSTLGAYVVFLSGVFSTIAGHLISASILSAPAAIVMSKLLVPEDGEPVTMGKRVELQLEAEPNGIAAIVNGAMAGAKLVVGVAALLIAFLGLVALANLALGGASGLFGAAKPWSLEMLLGYAMYPFAVMMGIPPPDAMQAGSLLGTRLVATEFPAYFELAAWMGKEGAMAHPRTAVVMAYALCGFAHVASMAIFVGGISALVPERRKDLAALGPRALLAATLACLMTGAVAGLFYHPGAIVLEAAAKGG